MEFSNVLFLLDQQISDYENLKSEIEDRSGALALDLQICALNSFKEKLLKEKTDDQLDLNI